MLLISEGKLDKSKTATAVRATFMKRATHDVPKELDPPPAEWEVVFDASAKDSDTRDKSSVRDLILTHPTGTEP